MMSKWGYLVGGALMLASGHASALTIDMDYSRLGTVYQGSNGWISSTFTAGATDVTAAFEGVGNYLASTLEKAIGVKWTETISPTLSFLNGAVATSGVSQIDGNGRPVASTITISNQNVFFIDPTPADNSEFAMSSRSATLGGGEVNVGRTGQAAAGTVAANAIDLSTVLLHEMIHSVAINAIDRYYSLVPGGNGNMVIPSSLTGLADSFDLPFSGGHVDPTADGGLFGGAVISPYISYGQRRLLAGSEIYAICLVEGCSASQVNTNPYATTVSAVPLPASGTLMLGGLLGLGGMALARGSRQRRRDSVGQAA